VSGERRSIRRAQGARVAGASGSRSGKAAERRGRVGGATGLVAVGVAALLIAAVIVGVLLATGRSGAPQRLSASALRRQTEDKVSGLLAGIPQNGDTLGRPTAPVTLRIDSDLECATAKGFVVNLFPEIVQDLVHSGVVRVEYRSMKTDTHARKAFVTQQAAAIAAGEQGKMWDFVETFYYEQGREYTGYATESYLDRIARQVPGLNFSQWIHDRENWALRTAVLADNAAARAIGLHTTPAFLIGRTGGKMKKLTGRYIVREPKEKNTIALIDASELEEAIERLPGIRVRRQ
jgi:protein-disulfide isomerase